MHSVKQIGLETVFVLIAFAHFGQLALREAADRDSIYFWVREALRIGILGLIGLAAGWIVDLRNDPEIARNPTHSFVFAPILAQWGIATGACWVAVRSLKRSRGAHDL